MLLFYKCGLDNTACVRVIFFVGVEALEYCCKDGFLAVVYRDIKQTIGNINFGNGLTLTISAILASSSSILLFRSKFV